MANSCFCNAEWQLPLSRPGFLIWTNARRHSGLLRGYSINMDRKSTEAFLPRRGDPDCSTCTQTGSKWLSIKDYKRAKAQQLFNPIGRFPMRLRIVCAWMKVKVKKELPSLLFSQLLLRLTKRPHSALVTASASRYTIITNLIVFAVICIISVLIRSYHGWALCKAGEKVRRILYALNILFLCRGRSSLSAGFRHFANESIILGVRGRESSFLQVTVLGAGPISTHSFTRGMSR